MNCRPTTVLIAEDESIILLGFKSFLIQLGYDVVAEAYNGEMAVELAEAMNPDLLIMDVKMPKLDGIQALEKINSKRNKIIPCVFVTAHSDDTLISRAKDSGAFNYLIKPVTRESLKAAIEIAIQRFEDYISLSNELSVAQQALENRKYIERAKGYLMDNLNLKEQQALDFMQKKSRDTNKKLIVVAKNILKIEEAITHD